MVFFLFSFFSFPSGGGFDECGCVEDQNFIRKSIP